MAKKQTVFVGILEDRNTDVQVAVFTTVVLALEWAQARIAEGIKRGAAVEHLGVADLKRVGWLYFATYSEEGDCVRVEEKIVDPDEEETSNG